MFCYVNYCQSVDKTNNITAQNIFDTMSVSNIVLLAILLLMFMT